MNPNLRSAHMSCMWQCALRHILTIISGSGGTLASINPFLSWLFSLTYSPQPAAAWQDWTRWFIYTSEKLFLTNDQVSAASSLLFFKMHICQTFITENSTAGLPLISIPSLPTVQEVVAVWRRTEIFQELGWLAIGKYSPVVSALIQLLLRSDEQPHVPRSEVLLLHDVKVVLGLQVLLGVVLLLLQLLLRLYSTIEFWLELYLIVFKVVSLNQSLDTTLYDKKTNIFYLRSFV